MMLLELAVTSHPVRAAHAIFGAGAGLVYGVFSAFYWAVGGTDRLGLPAIYPALDWNKPGKTLLYYVILCIPKKFNIKKLYISKYLWICVKYIYL